MINVTCIPNNGDTYSRSIPLVSINTVTTSTDTNSGELVTWIKLWDGNNPVNVPVKETAQEIMIKSHLAKFGKLPTAKEVAVLLSEY